MTVIVVVRFELVLLETESEASFQSVNALLSNDFGVEEQDAESVPPVRRWCRSDDGVGTSGAGVGALAGDPSTGR